MIPWKVEGRDHDSEQTTVDNVCKPYTILPYLLSEGVLALFLRLESVHQVEHLRPFIRILPQGHKELRSLSCGKEKKIPIRADRQKKSTLFSNIVQPHWGF